MLSDLTFATVEDFETVKPGNTLTLNIKGQIHQWRVVTLDRVHNFKKYQPSNEKLIIFSNQQPDDFMILHK